MNRIYIIALSFIFIFINCKDENSDKYSLNDYKISENPLDNIEYCFSKAKGILGDSVFFCDLSGTQVKMASSLEYDLNWKWFFTNGNKTLIFDIKKRTITVNDNAPIGYEFVREKDNRLYLLLSPKFIWNKCVESYNTPLQSIDLYVPLIAPRTGFKYSLSGTQYFIYEADTGIEITK
jgi:hypothetical protein